MKNIISYCVKNLNLFIYLHQVFMNLGKVMRENVKKILKPQLHAKIKLIEENY